VAKRERLVYSTGSGRMCPSCKRSLRDCACRANPRATSAPAGDGIVRVSRETKGRKGKGVTLITGVPLATDELTALAKELKQSCGAGGTVREGVIEIQGDKREALLPLLSARGWTVKSAGG